jgi:hypothetical protein
MNSLFVQVISARTSELSKTFRIPVAGSYTIVAEVVDAIGAVTQKQMTVTVTDAPVTTADLQAILASEVEDALATGILSAGV